MRNTIDNDLEFCGTVHDSARFCAEVREERYGACEDDCETTAPYLNVMPEESKLNRKARLLDRETHKIRRDNRRQIKGEFAKMVREATFNVDIDSAIEEAMRRGTFSVIDL